MRQLSIQDKIHHYGSISEDGMHNTRHLAMNPWYIAQGMIPPHTIDASEAFDITSQELQEQGKISVEKAMKLIPSFIPPIDIHISEQDLQQLHASNGTIFFANHQHLVDPVRICQMQMKLLGRHANMHPVMNSVSRPQVLLEKAGGIPLMRGRDIKDNKKSGKIETRPHVLQLEEVPLFTGEFVNQTGRNMTIFPGGKLEPKTNGLKYNERSFEKTMLAVVDTILKAPDLLFMNVIIKYGRRVQMTVESIEERNSRDLSNYFSGIEKRFGV